MRYGPLVFVFLILFGCQKSESTLKNQPIPTAEKEKRQHPTNNNSAETERITESPVVRLEDVETAVRNLISEEDKKHHKWHDNNQKNDLEAQVDMALGTKIMALASVIAALMTGVGLFLICRTLKAANRSNLYARAIAKEAKNTTVAAYETAESARKTLALEQGKFRPWISINSVKVVGVSEEVNGIRMIEIEAEIENCGISPALEVVCVAAVYERREFADRINNIIVNHKFGGDIAQSSIGPSIVRKVPSGSFLTDNSTREWRDRSVKMNMQNFMTQFLILKVHYAGTNGTRYYSYASFMLTNLYRDRVDHYFTLGNVVNTATLVLNERHSKMI